MLGVCSASCRGDGARWGSPAERRAGRSWIHGEAEPAQMLPRTRAGATDPSRAEPTATGAPMDENQARCEIVAMPQRKHSASRTLLRASKTLGLPLPLTREPPRRRSIERRSYH